MLKYLVQDSGLNPQHHKCQRNALLKELAHFEEQNCESRLVWSMHQLHRSSQQVLFRPTRWLPCFTPCAIKFCISLSTCVFSCLPPPSTSPSFALKFYLASLLLLTVPVSNPVLTCWGLTLPLLLLLRWLSSYQFPYFAAVKRKPALLPFLTVQNTISPNGSLWFGCTQVGNPSLVQTAVTRSRGHPACIRNHLSDCLNALVCKSEVGHKKSHLSHIDLCHSSCSFH